jgi:hypothetical protein
VLEYPCCASLGPAEQPDRKPARRGGQGLLLKYGHPAEDAPPGARPMQLRMFYIPDEAPQ